MSGRRRAASGERRAGGGALWREASWRHRLEYVAFRSVTGAFGAAPEGWADRGGAGLGWLAARVGKPRWGVVSNQLERAFPEADGRWRDDVGQRCYAHLGAEAVAMLRLARLDRRKVRERTRLIGREILEEAAEAGRGILLVTAHFGNWELAGASITARGFPLDVVAARQRNLLFDRRVNLSRERLGMRVIPRGEARQGVLESLRAGRFVGILGDQDARRAGIFVDFFGRPAATARGPALLALRAGAPFATTFCIRLPGRRPRYEVRIERLSLRATGGGAAALGDGGTAEGTRGLDGRAGPSGNLAARVAALTQAHTSRLEALVRRHPEQYFWLHRRWKTPPPETAKELPEHSRV